jgi:hypothetical protein
MQPTSAAEERDRRPCDQVRPRQGRRSASGAAKKVLKDEIGRLFGKKKPK